MRNNMTGVTMVEILIASTVFALMSISLLGYVQYGSEAWKKGHQRLNVSSYYRAISDTIQRELQQADKVLLPAVGGPASSSLKYDIPLSSGSAYVGTATFLLEWVASDRTLRRTMVNSSPSVTTVISSMVVSSSDSSDSDTSRAPFSKTRLNYLIARDVAKFMVTRVSSWTVNVAIGIESTMSGDDERVESKLSTMTFVIPCGR